MSLSLIVYTYLGYPLLIWILSRLFARQTALPVPSEALPRVSLLVAAYNEEGDIAKRIDNALSLDYPRDLLDIVIASDGSTDNTSSIARRYLDRVQFSSITKSDQASRQS